MGSSLHQTAPRTPRFTDLFTFSADVQLPPRLSPPLASPFPRLAPRLPLLREFHSRTASPSLPRPPPRPLAPPVRTRCPLPAQRRLPPLRPVLAHQSFVPAPSPPARARPPPRRLHLRLSARAWAQVRAQLPRRLLPLAFVRAPRNLQCHQRVPQGRARPHRVPERRVPLPPLLRPGRALPHLRLLPMA